MRKSCPAGKVCKEKRRGVIKTPCALHIALIKAQRRCILHRNWSKSLFFKLSFVLARPGMSFVRVRVCAQWARNWKYVRVEAKRQKFKRRADIAAADVGWCHLSLSHNYRELVNPHHARTLCVFSQNCLSDGVPYLFLWASQFNVSVERGHFRICLEFTLAPTTRSIINVT